MQLHMLRCCAMASPEATANIMPCSQVAAVRAELQRQLGEAQALAEGRAAAIKEMQDKIQHLSARVSVGVG